MSNAPVLSDPVSSAPMPNDNESSIKLISASRRSFLTLSAAASAATALRILTEPMLAHAAAPIEISHEGVMINANENPLGPCAAAREAVIKMAPQGGRYSFWMTDDIVKQYAQREGLKPDYIRFYPGSSDALHYAVSVFASPQRSYVTADPGYEAGMFAAQFVNARVVKVPLAKDKDYAHDVRAMLAAAPDAGIFYIANPNNPTGTVTSHADIEYLVANKRKDSVVLIDEAYIHFSDTESALDLVKADKDVLVLRTFSKIYGMAGLRCGVVIGKPSLVEKIEHYGGWAFNPITALAAASASLKDSQLVPGAEAHQLRNPRQRLRLARSQRLLLRPLAIQLLHAGNETPRQGSDRSHGQTKRPHRTHLASLAHPRPHHHRHRAGDGPIPDPH